MITVIAIVAILMVAGVSLLSGTAAQARKAGVDLLTGMIEQARTEAITTRSHVVLAIAEPGDLPVGDTRCRLGLFKVETWPDGASIDVSGVLMNRWKTLETGVVLLGGEVDDIENPLDGQELSLTYGTTNPVTIQVHALVFTPHGGLKFPAGSSPVVLRVAEGGYRGGTATPNLSGGSDAIAENQLKVGRVTARPYRAN